MKVWATLTAILMLLPARTAHEPPPQIEKPTEPTRYVPVSPHRYNVAERRFPLNRTAL